MYVFDGDWVFATAALVGVTYYYYKNAASLFFKKRVSSRIFNEDKKALLIGCDYEGTSNELRGCSKDISEMDIFLSEKGFKTTLLCDDDDRNLQNIKAQPIASNILSELNDMAQNPKKQMFMHYSGHGSYVKDTSNDESDGRDEVIVASDNVLIRDDDINDRFLAKLPVDTKCFVLMDCCHSSTVLDLKYRYDKSSKFAIVENPKDKTVAEIICISGCMDSQTSADAYIAGTFRGAMTTAFLQAYKQNRGNATVKQHIEQMRLILKNAGYSQIPQLTYNQEDLGDKLLNYFLF